MATLQLVKEHELKFDLNAAKKFKNRYGMPLITAFGAMPSGFGGTPIPYLMDSDCLTHVVWCGLLHATPKFTVAKTEERIQAFLDEGGDITSILKAISEASKEAGLFGSRADDEDEEGEEDEEKEENEEDADPLE